MEESPAIVLNFGSSTVKAGIAGDETPISCFPNLSDENFLHFGYNAKELIMKNQVKPIFPYTNGIVSNWSGANGIWKHTFNDVLKSNAEEHSVLLIEPPFQPKFHRERICQIFLESFNVPSFYMGLSSLLSLYGSGRTSGLALNMGQGISHAVPIIEGCVQVQAISRFDISGIDITKQLFNKSLQKAQVNITVNDDFPDYALFDTMDNIKCKYCFYRDFAQINQNESPNYKLPDGRNISLTDELYEAPEIIFNPELIDKKCLDLPRTVIRAIQLCEPEYRSELYSRIITTGGTSRLKGLVDKLKAQIQNLSLPSLKPVISTSQTKDDGKGNCCSEYTDWIGGSIVATLSTFQQMWVTRDEYNEAGPTVIHRKCL